MGIAAASLLLAVLSAAGATVRPTADGVSEMQVGIDAASHAPHAVDWPRRIAERLLALPERIEGPAPSDAVPTADLAAVLEPLVARAAEQAAVAVAVHDAVTGTLLFRWDAERSLVPASNHKLLTAVAALELLGPEFRFETTLHRRGNTLYLRGDGDPSLQVEHLTQLLQSAAHETDLGTVEQLVFDDTAFTRRAFGPGYDPFGAGYGYTAPSGALSLQFNTVEITVRGTGKSRPPQVFVDPPCDYVQVVTRAGGPLQVSTTGTDAHTLVHVSGKLPRGRTAKVRRRIYHPGLFAASVLARKLAPHVRPFQVTAGRVPEDAQHVATLTSAPLRELLGSALRFSNNFTAEQILRTLGHRATGTPGDWVNGGEVLRRYAKALGLDPASLDFENASGLSLRGRMSPAALVQMLLSAAHDDALRGSLRQALATAGREGTLHARLTRLRDRVQAKTGTLDHASALSGWLLTEDQPSVVFSILVNDAPSRSWARRLQDTIVLQIAAALDPR